MRFQCPICHKLVAVDDSQQGNQVQCGHCNEAVSVPPSRFATGAVIADFVIMKEIGRGGMGVVYLAHQISLDRPAALKILQDSYANNAEFVVNFIKEARLAAKLNHPHIVQAYAVGEDEGVFYFAMEYIDGETMKSVLRREKVIPVDQAVTLIQQVAEALDCAWKEQKLVHRDIKPDNIMLTKKGQAKLADLGLSQVAGELDDEDSDEVMGTPQYISPEQLTGAPVDVRSDIYSLGATFYQFVTGRFPYEGRNGNEIARKHLEAELVPPQQVNTSVPEAVGQIICKMMKKNVNERYQDAESLVEDLRVLRRGKTGGGTLPKVFSTQTGSVARQVMPGGGTTSSVDMPKLTPRSNDAPKITPKPAGARPAINLKTPINMKKKEPERAPVQPQAAEEAASAQAPEPETNSPTEGIKPIFDQGQNVNTQTNNNLVLDPQGVEDLKDFRPRRKIRQITLLVISVVLLIGAGAITYMYWFHGDSVQIPITPPKPQDPDTPVVDSYVTTIDEALKKASGNLTPAQENEFLARVDEFFEKYPEAKTPEQQQKLAALLDVYVKLDNKNRVEPARKKAYDKHQAEVAQRKKTLADLAAQEKAVRDEQARIQRENAANQERIRKEQAEIKARDQKYTAALGAIKTLIPYHFHQLMLENKFKEMGDLQKQIAQETNNFETSTPAVRTAITGLNTYMTNLTAELKKAREYYNLLYNSGTTLERIQVETKIDNNTVLLQLRNIQNGVIQMVDNLSGKVYNLKIAEMQPEMYDLIINRIERRQPDVKDLKFYVQIYNGNFANAQPPAGFWKTEFNAYKTNFEREKSKGSKELVLPKIQ